LGGGFAHDPAQNSGLASMGEGTPSPGHGEPRADPDNPNCNNTNRRLI